MSLSISSTTSDTVIATHNVEFAADVKRRVAKGANKNKSILDHHIQNINQAITNSKQNVVKALLEARNLEKAKTQTIDIHNNLHRQLLEKLHPNIFAFRELVHDSITYNFRKPLNGETLAIIDSAMKWNYPKLLQMLVDAIQEYSDTDFRDYLSSIPDRFLPMSEGLFAQIAELGSKGSVSATEAKQIYVRTKADNIQDPRREWYCLQNRLCRKILQLFLVKTATPIVLQIEEKFRSHHGFQFVISKGNSQTLHSLNSSLSGSCPPGITQDESSLTDAVPATSSIHTDLSPRAISLHRASSSSRAHSDPPTTASSTIQRIKKLKLSESAKTSPKRSKKRPSTTLSTSADQLAEALQYSQQKQEALKNRMMESMANFVMEHSSEYSQARSSINSGKLPRRLPTTSTATATSPVLQLSASTSSLPPLELRPLPSPAVVVVVAAAAATGSSSVVTVPNECCPWQRPPPTSSSTSSFSSSHMAIEQYIKKTSAQKLVDSLYHLVLTLLGRKWLHWKRIHHRVLLEYKCDLATRYLATFRMLRWMQFRTVRRMHHAWTHWTTLVSVCEEEERLSATLDIQRCYRGFLGRKRAQMEATLRAAQSIQQTFRIFFAKKAAVTMRLKTKRKRAVRRLESMWMRYKHLLAHKKRQQFETQMRCALRIQRVFRGHLHGRKKRTALLLHTTRMRGARAMQTLFRAYRAKCRVDALRRHLLCNVRVVILQAAVRRGLQRHRYLRLLRRHRATLVLTYAWWCHRARHRRSVLARHAAARRIQCALRCHWARRRRRHEQRRHEAWLQRRVAAIRRLQPLFSGYLTRRRWRPVLATYLQQRRAAAVPIQCLVRRSIARRRAATRRRARDDQRHRVCCAIRLQALVRAKIGAYYRVVAQRRRRAELLANDPDQCRLERWPYYYRLQATYVASQDVYHRKFVVRIQCCVRQYLARRRVARQRRQRSAAVIEAFVSGRVAVRSAKRLVAERRLSLARQTAQVLLLQRMVRGMILRRRYRRTRAVATLRWLMREVAVRRKIAEAMHNHRTRKAYERMYRDKVIQVQAWVRARLGQRRYKQQFRTLVRQRAMRMRAKREKKALIIQCAYRVHRARLKVQKQRVLFADRAREMAELRLLEESLEGLHGDWMQELLVIRAQTGFRGHMARENFRKRVEEYKVFHTKEQEMLKHRAAATIQALIRGVLGRKAFKKNLPTLKRARRTLALCIECETKPATRRCRQCRDKYCADCFDLIHAKGHRKEHSWENVTVDTRMLAMTFDTKTGGNEGMKPRKKGKHGWEEGGGGGGEEEGDRKGRHAGNQDAPIKKTPTGRTATTTTTNATTSAGATGKGPVNKGDWEEFFDPSAHAKYWYNKKTGEASWINPFQ